MRCQRGRRSRFCVSAAATVAGLGGNGLMENGRTSGPLTGNGTSAAVCRGCAERRLRWTARLPPNARRLTGSSA